MSDTQLEQVRPETRPNQRTDTPPAGEEIHLPGPSFIPVICAVGITLTVVGTTIWWVYSVIGLVIFITSTTIWIRDVRRDVSELPEEHGHH